jgi:hypothetical protein
MATMWQRAVDKFPNGELRMLERAGQPALAR